MTDNSFCIKVRDNVVPFLTRATLLKENIFNPDSHYSDRVKEIARNGSQYDILNEIWNTYSYDLLLKDDSIFQFHKEGDNLRYCFMQNPKVKISWEEYLYKYNLKEKELAADEFELWRGCYDNGDDESCYTHCNYPVYLRYDVSDKQYIECFHPYSHLHVGLHNEIRFPIAKILTPEMFAQIVVKMTYPEVWKKMMEQNGIKEFYKMVKKGCKDVPKNRWSELDKCDLFFL